MDAFTDPFVEEITVMAASQVGKTESMYNMLGYLIDQDPGPTLVVMPRESDAKGVSYNRILPMIEGSHALTEHLPELTDDITKLEYHLDRMILYFAGSNSPADLASRPIRYLFLDEVDKYPRFSGREADPIKLASERQKTFWNKKTVKVSTPTTRDGYIFREYEKSDRRRFYAPCPHCGKFQVLVFGQIKWPTSERSVEQIKNEKLAWYECCHCERRIKDYQKPKMLLEGLWVPDGAEVSDRGTINGEIIKSKHRGFWINSLYSPWLSWSDIASEFLKSKDYVELLMNFVNSWLAEVWEEKAEETHHDKVIALALDYPEGEAPDRALVLTAGVDVQKDHFYLAIRGWGIGEESWLIRACRVESWEEIEAILFKTNYKRRDGMLLRTRLACIDSGFRTAEVYEFCRRWRDVARPVKGEERLSGVPFKITRIERNPKTGAVIEGGISLWRIDTSLYKDKITRMISAAAGDPAKWHLFANPSEEYIKQFCSEHKVIIRDKKSGRTHEEWRKKTAAIPNHYWDTEVYSVAAADMIHVSAMREENQAVVYQLRRPPEWIHKSGSWLGNRKQWLE